MSIKYPLSITEYETQRVLKIAVEQNILHEHIIFSSIRWLLISISSYRMLQNHWAFNRNTHKQAYRYTYMVERVTYEENYTNIPVKNFTVGLFF